MDNISHLCPKEIPAEHVCRHEGFEFYKRALLRRGQAGCVAAQYEIPPGKAAFPYHYHVKNEEMYYILSGAGTLKTPQGERAVKAGDFLFFPANESGAHKLTNTGSEPLTYLDFDTAHDIDVTLYPDSDKIAVWGKEINQVYKIEDQVAYYEGE